MLVLVGNDMCDNLYFILWLLYDYESNYEQSY